MAGKTHKPHPKCICGRPLFKSFEKGARVSREDPYKFCRNAACAHSGTSGLPTASLKAPKPLVRSSEDPPVRARVSRARSQTKRRNAPNEHPGVTAARLRIRELVKDATKGAPKSAIGLVLALVTQETGAKAAANLLIKEYDLDKLFGIQVQ